MDIYTFKKCLYENNPELRRYIIGQKLKKLFKVLLINVFVGFLIYMTLPAVNNQTVKLGLILLWILFCILFGAFSKPSKLIFGKDFIGVIESAKTRDGYVPSEENIRRVSSQVFLDLMIRDQNGKRHCISLKGKYEPCYRTEDEVAVLHGLKYPLFVSLPEKRKTVCCYCGSIKSDGEFECQMCGRSYFL